MKSRIGAGAEILTAAAAKPETDTQWVPYYEFALGNLSRGPSLSSPDRGNGGDCQRTEGSGDLVAFHKSY